MLNYFIPAMHVETIYDIDLDDLKNSGISGIITDLDNTLVGAREALATPELVKWLKDVETAGFRVVIVSNNRRARVQAFSEPLGLKYIYSANKPRNRAFRQALQLLGLQPGEVAVIGDQMLTDVLGGNRMGLHTILVKPISVKDEGMFTRVNRRIEKVLKARLKKKGFSLWEEHHHE